jgi:hypothetical protein
MEAGRDVAANGPARRDALLAELDAARDAFHAVLADVDAELVTAPGVVGDWSVRDLVVHVAFWDEHAVGALELAAAGRGAEFAYSSGDTDAMNARLFAETQGVSPSAALDREESAFADLRERLARLDPGLLDLRLGNGDSVEEVIRYDGPDHYAEHTEHLRGRFTDAGDEDAPHGDAG